MLWGMKPIKGRVAGVARNDGQLSSRLSSMSPSRLSAILKRSERGDVRDWADVCDRMVQIDGHVRANYETRTAAVSGARWEIAAGESGDAARDAVAADGALLAERILRGTASFADAVAALLDGIGVGFGVVELDWAFADEAWAFDQMWWVHQRRFAYTPEWELAFRSSEEHGGRLLSEWPDRFVVHEPQSRPGYAPLAGCLRPVAWMFLFKRWATQFWVTGAERFAWPIMKGTVPRNAPDSVRAALQDTLDNVSSDHSMVHEDGDTVTYLESQLKDAGTWQALSGYLNGEISKAILGSVDQTEPAKVGAWKAVESRKGTTVDSRTAIDARQLEATVSRGILEPLMRHNAHLFGGVVPTTPKIRWVVAEQKQPISATAVSSGSVTVDEVRVRDGLDPWGGEEGSAVATTGGRAAEGFPLVGQITALKDIVTAVGLGELSPETAAKVIAASLPMSIEEAKELFDNDTPDPLPSSNRVAARRSRT